MEYQIPETPRKNGRMITAPVSKDHGTAEGDHSGDEPVVKCRKEGRCVDAEAHEQERDRV